MNREQPGHLSDEQRVAAEMARDLEAMTVTSAVGQSEGFADRVMSAIASEPLPQPVRAFGLALLGGHVRTAAAALGDAWRTISSAPAPLAVRAQALALVLVILVASLTLAGGATVGAVGLLANTPPASGPSDPPSGQVTPAPTPPSSPSSTPEEAPSASPEVPSSAEPTGSPKATETSGSHETARPTERPRTATPTATDDHGGGDGSGSGSGSGGGDQTPDPTETVDPSGSSDG